jgi:hypothetical protein
LWHSLFENMLLINLTTMRQENKDPRKGSPNNAGTNQDDHLNTNSPAGDRKSERTSNDDYKREGAQLGATSSGSAQSTGSGYDPQPARDENANSGTGVGFTPNQTQDKAGNASAARQTGNVSATKQSGGGASGYDVNREMAPIKEEQENMKTEREQNDLDVERTQTPRPENDPGRENPQPTTPQREAPQRETPERETPQTNPGSSETSGPATTSGRINSNSIR